MRWHSQQLIFPCLHPWRTCIHGTIRRRIKRLYLYTIDSMYLLERFSRTPPQSTSIRIPIAVRCCDKIVSHTSESLFPIDQTGLVYIPSRRKLAGLLHSKGSEDQDVFCIFRPDHVALDCPVDQWPRSLAVHLGSEEDIVASRGGFSNPRVRFVSVVRVCGCRNWREGREKCFLLTRQEELSQV